MWVDPAVGVACLALTDRAFDEWADEALRLWPAIQRRRAGRGHGMMYRPGDRVRFETTGDDGWPLIRYGFVGGVSGNGGPIVVMLDGELSGDVVNRSELQPVTITSVELLLRGADLIDDPDCAAVWSRCGMPRPTRRGSMSTNCTRSATGSASPMRAGRLAELMTADQHYIVRAIQLPNEPEIIRVRAESR